MHKIIIDEIYVPYLDHKRPIRIYLPPNYDDNTAFPVVYMHDAQNLFDTATSSYGAIWDIHDHMNAIYSHYKQGYIVVGIDNHEGRNNRLNEYSPWVNTTLKDNTYYSDIQEDVGGLGEKYVNFLVNDLIPYINKQYKTLSGPYALIGSSMGGFISLYAGVKYPEIFNKIGAFSTAVWFAEKPLLELMENSQYSKNSQWYLDIGTKETSNEAFDALYMEGTQKVYEILEKKVQPSQRKLVIDDGGIHNERDWSKRFYKAFEFLYQLNQ
ncbi:MAG: alpha/beta hydrolase [Clostridia bacterium]|nr:alpha/beta hydrolase [Clostridia bacterium]